MQSVYDLATETKQKCQGRYNPVEYALSRSANATDKDNAELWQKVADVLKSWQSGS